MVWVNMTRDPGELAIMVRSAVVAWRDARQHLATLDYRFERTKKGNEVAEQPDMIAAWKRLANAEHALMSLAKELK